ncbi:glycosyltransferase family 2 protein [Arthrobacter gyeryongensis]|uniref:glycosyltransferase family 2 protein n=1 Tax=Arthrobacter gyeryongensis TaxID=1650592 RepID=UPI0031EB8355
MKLHVIVASHNRRRLTLQCLQSLAVAGAESSFDTDIVLFDDGSTDGTAEEVRLNFKNATTIQGSGSAFWAAGMASAESAVLSRPDVEDSDYILWLNDDVELDVDALQRFESILIDNESSIIVGAVRDPNSGVVTYSGLRRAGWHPLSFGRVAPDAMQLVGVESFNGNVVIVPVKQARQLAGIDGGFSHAFADIDYGLRANRIGVSVWLAPGTFGTCPINTPPSRESILTDWRKFTGIKGGGNFRSLTRILKRISPRAWPAYIATTYSLWWLRQILARVLGSRFN